MSARSLAKATNVPQADSAVKTSLLKHSGVKPVEAEPKQQPEDWAKQNFEQKSGLKADFSRIPVGGSSHLVVQPKLVVGRPGDRYEQEADRVAEQVVQMPEQGTSQRIKVSGQVQPPLIQSLSPEFGKNLQRQSDNEEEEDKEKKKDEEEESTVQAKAKPGQISIVPPALEASLASSQGGGQPLPTATKSFMESRFNHDFSKVRVHTNSRADQLTHRLNAQALTHQHDIFFRAGHYNPESLEGRRLLAHELTHVVQQTGSRQIQPKLLVQLRAQPTSLQRRQAPRVPQTAQPAVEETPETEAAPPRPEPERVTPRQEERPEAERPTPETARAQSVAPAEAAAVPPTSAPPAPAGTARPDVELLMPEPPSELSEAAQSRLEQAQNQTNQAAVTTAELPSAEANVESARGAVEEPQEETQARADEALVEALGERPEPSAEIEELCERIGRIIKEKRPPDEESLVKADPEEAAREAGNQLNQSIEGDVERVEGSYDQLDEAQEGTPQQLPEEIETPPEQVETPEIGAAEAVPDPVPAEDVSLDADVEASSARLEEAGMNTEPARLAAEGAPNGPIAEAQAAQGELAETAQRDPAEVLAEQQQALTAASADMAALQEAALAVLMTSRASTVTGVQGQQTAMVGSEERMRAQVGQQAQQIFSRAQQQVNTLLAPLQQNAMNKWEQGKTVLTTRFRQRLNRVEQWVEEEYGGVVGRIVKFFAGLPDWVTEEYNQAEQDFGDGVCDLIREISTEVNSVVVACEQIIDNARQDIDALFDNLPQELQEWAAGEKERFGAQLDGLQNQVTQARDNFNRDLANRAAQSVQEVREEIHALREAAKGLLGKIADAVNAFLEDPAKFIIEGLLSLLGIAPAAFWAVVNKIDQAINDIANDPETFTNNLLSAIGQGFQQFFDNFADHILNGLLEWLFSGLGAVGVQIPTDFSLKSIITFFLQLMGISWERIRRLLAKHIGEENVALLEKAYEIIANLIEMGPEGIFEMIKDQLNPQSILDQVLQAAVDFLIEALIKAVTVRVIALFNPVGAIVEAIKAIYKVLKWIFENAARIFSLIETVVNGITAIIAGDIGGMANAVEGALARLVAPVVDFLAGFLGIGDLPDKIADTIRGFQEWIEGILDRVIGWLAERAKALLRSLGIDGEQEDNSQENVSNWSEPFTNSLGEKHRVRAIERGRGYALIINPEPIDALIFLESSAVDQNDPNIQSAKSLAEHILSQLDRAANTSNDLDKNDLQIFISEDIDKLAVLLSRIKLASDHIPTGDNQNDPIPMIWYKPVGIYPPSIVLSNLPERENRFFFNEPDSVRVPRTSGLADVRREANAATDQFTIGIDPSGPFYPREGKIYPRVRVGAVRTGRKQAEFRRLLRTLGFSWGSYEADHIRDLQWAGQDSYDNLWPLERSYNNAANRVLNQTITYLGSGGSIINEPLNDSPLNLYFIINDIQRP